MSVPSRPEQERERLDAIAENFSMRDGFNGYMTKYRVTTILENERHAGGEALQGLLLRMALAVGPWDLGAVGDEPFAIPLHHGRELIRHGPSVLPPA